MLWLEIKYINFLASQLESFRWTSTTQANFRCPYCGDSKTNPRKSRGYLYQKMDKRSNEIRFFFSCFNCDRNNHFTGLLWDQNPSLSREFRFEKLKEQDSNRPIVVKPKPVIKGITSLGDLVCTDTLPLDHPANLYLFSRGIDSPYFYWTPDTDKTIKLMNPDDDHKFPHDGRVCLLMKYTDQSIFGITARSIDPDEDLRYIIAKFDENAPKLYGLDRFDKNKLGFLLEGPIDSLLLPNALGMCGGEVSESVLGDYVNKDNLYVVLDNEPRKPDTIKRMTSFINRGYRVTIWKNISSDFKDINDMIVKGKYTRKDILEQIAQNSFSGLEATMELNNWKKCDIQTKKGRK